MPLLFLYEYTKNKNFFLKRYLFTNQKISLMKVYSKIILFSLSFCLLAFSAQAQLSLGFKGGVNLAKQTFEDGGIEVTSDDITGYTFGAVLEIPLGGNIYLQPEFILIQKGAKLDLFGDNIKATVNYIDVPILLELKIINAGPFEVNIHGGPTFGYATNGEITENNVTVDLDFDDDSYRRWEVGINAGGGVGLNLGNIGLFGDIRYLFGLSNLSDEDEVTARNKGFNLSAGLLFRLGG